MTNRSAHGTGSDVGPSDLLGGIAPGPWYAVPEASSVEFIARHFLVSRVRGRFDRFWANFEFSGVPGECAFTGAAEIASLTTGDPARDGHLRSPDFFHSERWPVLKLSGHLHADPNGGLRAHGSMTIRDTEHAVEFNVAVGTPNSDTDGTQTLRVMAQANVNRQDFGLRWNSTIETGGIVVSDQVELVLDLMARPGTSPTSLSEAQTQSTLPAQVLESATHSGVTDSDRSQTDAAS